MRNAPRPPRYRAAPGNRRPDRGCRRQGCRTRCRPAGDPSPSKRPSAPDARGMRERAALVEPVRHRQRLAVVGDRDVARSPAARAAAAIVSRSSRPSVSVVCMCRSPRRSARSIRRGSVRAAAALDLAAVLAQFRRNPREAERVVDLLLAFAGHAVVVRDAKQTVLVQLQPDAGSRDRAARCCAPSSR